MKTMTLELAFFDGDDLLYQETVECQAVSSTDLFEGTDGHQFKISSLFEEPACPVSIICSHHGKKLYEVALRVGVHDSEDWESIDLGGIHTLGFRVRIENNV